MVYGFLGRILWEIGIIIFHQFNILLIIFGLMSIYFWYQRIYQEENFLLNKLQPSKQKWRKRVALQYQKYNQKVKYKIIPYVF